MPADHLCPSVCHDDGILKGHDTVHTDTHDGSEAGDKVLNK